MTFARRFGLLALFAALLLAGGWMAVRRFRGPRLPTAASRPETDASAPAPRTRGTPEPARPSAAAPALPRAEPPPGNLDLYYRLRDGLLKEVEERLASGGPDAAWERLLGLLAGAPGVLEERVRKALALTFLPLLHERSPLLRPEIEREIRRHADSDADPWTRVVALATLTGRPVFFSRVGPDGGFFFARLSKTLPETGEVLDGRAFRFSDGAPPWIRESVRGALASADPDARTLALDLLAEAPSNDDGPWIERAARRESDPDARQTALATLGALPPSPSSLELLRAAMEGDPSPPNRRVAADALIRLGVVDERIASVLTSAAEKTPGDYRALGRAYRVAALPSIAGVLREALRSPARAAAIDAIRESRSPDFVPALRAAREAETDAAARREIDAALAELERR